MIRNTGIHQGPAPSVSSTSSLEDTSGDIGLARLPSRTASDLTPPATPAPQATLKSYSQRLRPSRPLAEEAAGVARELTRGGTSKLDQAQARMVLEGKYAQEQPHVAFQDQRTIVPRA
ncbi:hypothetical protein [Pseudomonas sp. SDO5201_S390]